MVYKNFPHEEKSVFVMCLKSGIYETKEK